MVNSSGVAARRKRFYRRRQTGTKFIYQLLMAQDNHMYRTYRNFSQRFVLLPSLHSSPITNFSQGVISFFLHSCFVTWLSCAVCVCVCAYCVFNCSANPLALAPKLHLLENGSEIRFVNINATLFSLRYSCVVQTAAATQNKPLDFILFLRFGRKIGVRRWNLAGYRGTSNPTLYYSAKWNTIREWV